MISTIATAAIFASVAFAHPQAATTTTAAPVALATAAADFPYACLTGNVECALGDLVADCMLTQTGSDFAFLNNGGFGKNQNITKGQVVTDADVKKIFAYGDVVVTYAWTGQQIVDQLTFSAVMHHNSTTNKDYRVRFPQLSGVSFSWSNSTGAVTNVQIGSAPISLTTSYQIATLDFLVTGGGGLIPAGTVPKAVSTGSPLTTVVDTCFTSEISLTAPTAGRVTIVA